MEVGVAVEVLGDLDGEGWMDVAEESGAGGGEDHECVRGFDVNGKRRRARERVVSRGKMVINVPCLNARISLPVRSPE